MQQRLGGGKLNDVSMEKFEVDIVIYCLKTADCSRREVNAHESTDTI